MSADLVPVFQHLNAGRFAEAELTCREGLLRHGVDAGLSTLLGVALHRLGRSDEAKAVFRRTVRIHPDAAEALGNLAVLLSASPGHEDEAERCLHRLRAIRPESLLAAQRLATLRQLLGDSEGALRHLRRATRLNPTGPSDLFNLGIAAVLNGEPDRAIDAFRALQLLEPGNASAYAQAGAAQLTLGRTDLAAMSLERASRLDPGDAGTREGLGRLARYRAAVAGTDGPPGLLVRGPYRGLSGYAHMTNRLIDTLRAAGTPVHSLGLLGSEPWADPPASSPAARSLVNCMIPPVVEPVPGLMTVTFSMFEGTRIPAFWSRFSALHDLVVVPTLSSRSAWLDRGFPEDRLRVCPLGVDAETPDGPVLSIATPNGRTLSSFRHRILNVSDFIPRKNIDGVLRVWLKATSATDDAVLVLKLGKGNPQTHAAIQDLFRRTEEAVGRRLAEAAPVLILARTLDEEAMTALFRSCTHYWSLSHGEGWDLPMSKAGAMGLQLVAPAHSAYVDYLDETVARMIPSAVGPAHLPNSRRPWPTFYGLDWWEPDEEAAAEIVGRIVQGRDDRPRDARSRLLERFTWNQAADRLLAVLRETGAL